MFNKGFKCPNCGPVESAKKKTINKVQYDTCPNCSSIVSKWDRPLNERDGRCGNCGNGAFTLALVKSQLLRCCKVCKEVYNTDRNNIVREGDKQYEYKPTK